MTEHINDRHEDKHFGDEEDFAVNKDTDSTPFANDAGPVGEPTVDDAFDHAEATAEGRHDTVDGTDATRPSADQLGQNLRKAAEDTAYAAVGFVGLVTDKAKEFYEDQKKQYAEAHPEADAEHGAKNFLNQLKEQLDKLIDDVNRSFRDLAERGRTTGRPMEDEMADKVDNLADDLDDAAKRAAENVEEFGEGRPNEF